MRLRRGVRNKETAADSAAASVTAASTADEPGPIQPPPSGSVLGLSAAIGNEPPEPTGEWGLYDPDLAGIGALLATIDTSAIAIPDDLDQDPGDLLLRQKVSSATEPIDVFPPASASNAEETSHPSQVATAVASCRVPHLAPLSLWARVAEPDRGEDPGREPDRIGGLLAQRLRGAVPRIGSQLASSDLAAEIGRLMHPALVAMTGLSPACRIRGIRTAPAAAFPEAPDEPPSGREPDVVSTPEVVSMQASEELGLGAEPPASAVQVEVHLESVAGEPAREQQATEPEAMPEAVLETAPVFEVVAPDPDAPVEALQVEALAEGAHAQADKTETLPALADLPSSEEPPAVEPPPVAETAEDLGIVVTPPTLDALSIDFMDEAPPVEENQPQPDADQTSAVEPAAEAAPIVAEVEAAPGYIECAPVTVGPDLAQVLPPQESPPQVVAPPVKKRRRTALALG